MDLASLEYPSLLSLIDRNSAWVVYYSLLESIDIMHYRQNILDGTTWVLMKVMREQVGREIAACVP